MLALGQQKKRKAICRSEEHGELAHGLGWKVLFFSFCCVSVFQRLKACFARHSFSVLAEVSSSLSKQIEEPASPANAVATCSAESGKACSAIRVNLVFLLCCLRLLPAALWASRFLDLSQSDFEPFCVSLGTCTLQAAVDAAANHKLIWVVG